MLVRQPRPLNLLRSDIDNDTLEVEITDSLHRGYSRPKIANIPEEELNDYVKFRLFLARLKALEEFNKKWG